tara:strand:+ start:3866 stop:4183 length:318 start_codon:yes stop_codon:yes gene_type:complete
MTRNHSYLEAPKEYLRNAFLYGVLGAAVGLVPAAPLDIAADFSERPETENSEENYFSDKYAKIFTATFGSLGAIGGVATTCYTRRRKKKRQDFRNKKLRDLETGC